MQAKFFREEYQSNLEKEVNNFIRNKDVINISYSVIDCGYNYIHCCCVLYRELTVRSETNE